MATVNPLAGNRRSWTTILLVGTPLALIVVFFSIIVLVLGAGPASAVCSAGSARADPATAATQVAAGYTGVQLANAAYIMNAAVDLGLQRDAQVLGVMTAMGESGLMVLDRGDVAGPDSRGLFQQRDNGVWGSYTDRMDPTISATSFFTALQKIDGWQSLEPTIAAHRVQGNADPRYYEQFFDPANEVVTALIGDAGKCSNGSIALPLAPGFNMTGGYGARTVLIEGAGAWHPAVDLQHWPNNCNDQIYSIVPGTVAYIGGYQVDIKSPDGYTVTYMHMKLSDVSVTVGQTVGVGTPIALTGSEGPSTGCHLDLRINLAGNTNASLNDLQRASAIGGPGDYVDPEQFYAKFGMTLCDPASCRRPS